MAFNGSGTFNRIHDWTDDRDAGTKVNASRMDAEMDGMATGLSTCITKDGQTNPTANLKMNARKHTGVAVGTARTDYGDVGSIQDGGYHYALDSGAADVYVIGPSPAITAYVTGMEFLVKIGSGHTNTGASTINVSGVGAKNIKTPDAANPDAGTLIAGQLVRLAYDGTNFQIVSFPAGTGVSGGTITWAKGADVASAAALPVLTDGNFFDVTGTTAITSINTLGIGTLIGLQFDDALILTHHSTNLALPGGANITTAEGDVFLFVENGSGEWGCVSYALASGKSISGAGLIANTFTGKQTLSSTQQILAKGADVSSEADLTLETDGNYFDITGTTAITSIGTLGIGAVVTLHFDGALVLTHHATNLILPNGQNILTAAGDELTFVEFASADWRCIGIARASGRPVSLPISYIGGLKCSNDTDTDHDVNMTAGAARDATNAIDITLASEITKKIDASFAVGNDAGGIDAGAVGNSTLYAIWLIIRSDTGIVDFLFSTSFTNPTMPSNYDYKRLIWAVKTDGSGNIIQFLQSGYHCRYMGDVIQDHVDTTITDLTYETATLASVPPSCMAHLYVRADGQSGADLVYLNVKTKGASDDTTVYESVLSSEHSAAGGQSLGGQVHVLVDSAQQIEYSTKEAGGAAQVTIRVSGFDMFTRNDP